MDNLFEIESQRRRDPFRKQVMLQALSPKQPKYTRPTFAVTIVTTRRWNR
jgi:hypothetical protein